MRDGPQLNILTEAETRAVYDSLYRRAFPPMELRPYDSIREMTAAGVYRTLVLAEGGEPLCYASVWDGEGGFSLLDYLVSPPERRGRGGGGAMLRALAARLGPEDALVIESEAPTGRPEADVLIRRRLAFYRRCGARELGYDAGVFGVRYRLLYLSPAEQEGEVLLGRYRALYRSRTPLWLWKLAFRIPVAAGEELPSFAEWKEERKR